MNYQKYNKTKYFKYIAYQLRNQRLINATNIKSNRDVSSSAVSLKVLISFV